MYLYHHCAASYFLLFYNVNNYYIVEAIGIAEFSNLFNYLVYYNIQKDKLKNLKKVQKTLFLKNTNNCI